MEQVAPRHSILDEYAADLAVAHVHIVGPFHTRLYAVMRQHVGHTERRGLADSELHPRRNSGRAVEKRGADVAPRFRLPRIAPLTASGSLRMGSHKRHVIKTVGMYRNVCVGGIRLLKQQYLHIQRVYLVQRSSVILRDSSGSTEIPTVTVSSGSNAEATSGHSIRQRAPESKYSSRPRSAASRTSSRR